MNKGRHISTSKSLAIGAAAGETVNQTPRLWSGKTWNENVMDSTFLKNIQKAYPDMTDFAASLINPGYYLGFGAKGLEYTGLLGKQLTNGISNTVTRAKNLFTKYTSRINPVTGKFEIVPEVQRQGKSVAALPSLENHLQGIKNNITKRELPSVIGKDNVSLSSELNYHITNPNYVATTPEHEIANSIAYDAVNGSTRGVQELLFMGKNEIFL